MLALITCLLLAQPPEAVQPLEVTGRVQKPEAFVVVGMPAELAPTAAPAHATRAELEVLAASRDYQRLSAALTETDEGSPVGPQHEGLVKRLESLGPAGRLEVVRLGLIAWVATNDLVDGKRAHKPLLRLVALTRQGALAQWARMSLGEEAFVAMKMDDAERWYREAVAVAPQSPYADYVRYKLGWTLVNLSKKDAAIAELEALAAKEGFFQSEAKAALAIIRE